MPRSWREASHTRSPQTSIDSSHRGGDSGRLGSALWNPLPAEAARAACCSSLLAIALPWLWFVVRDVGGPLDTVAVGLPLIAVAAIVSGRSSR